MRFIALVLYLVVALTEAKKSPNILFLMVDEMDGRVLDPNSPQAILAKMSLKYDEYKSHVIAWVP